MQYKEFFTAVVLAIFVFAISITLMSSVPVIRLMQYAVSVNDVSDVEDLTRTAIQYSTGWRIGDIEISERTVFTPEELDHLADVRRVYQGVMLLGGLSVLVLMSVLVYSRSREWAWRRRDIIGRVLHGINAVFIILFLLLVVFFNRVFTAVHTVLFPAGTWEFPPQSTLIRLFPERFWIVWCIVTVVFIISLLGTLGVALRQKRSIDRPSSAVKDR